MDLKAAQDLAESLMQEHLDNPEDWTFEWETTVTQHGATYYRQCKIKLSRLTTEMEIEETVRDTMLHEIAHANVWDRGEERGHSAAWKREAKRLGAVPRPEGSGTTVDIRAERAPWVGPCDMGHEGRVRYWRKPRVRRSCEVCHPGRFSPAYLITYTKEA
jgi:predicted SprT family Zn-dependent metalloprotease